MIVTLEQGSSDGGLLLVRELDERLGFGELITRHLSDSRRLFGSMVRRIDALVVAFHKQLSGPHQLVCLISLVSSPSCYGSSRF